MLETTDAPPAVDAVQQRTIRTLLASQTLASVGSSAGFAVSSLAATTLAPGAGSAGVAQGLSMVGTVIATSLLSRLTAARGRRPGLAAGYVAAGAGAALCGLALQAGWFAVFLAGSVLFGTASAAGFQSRFAASDLAPPGQAAKGISLVLWMSTIGAIIGPNTVAIGDAVEGATHVSGLVIAYLASATGFGFACAVVVGLLRPDPLLEARRRAAAGPPSTPAPADTTASTSAAPRRSLRAGLAAVRASAPARYALATSVIAHATMVGVMTWTPVHLAHASSHTVIGLVFSVHMLGMYAFSPLFGRASARWGGTRTITAGLLTLVASLLLGWGSAPSDHARVGLALLLLGLGWSQAFITASGVFSDHIAVEDRPAAQGLLDACIWTGSGVAMGVGGWVTGTWSYGTLCACALVIVVPTTLWSLARVR
ncbi:MAG: MFS transporter [Kineosporiaceae bacterium]